jgi:hypothetical protein
MKMNLTCSTSYGGQKYTEAKISNFVKGRGLVKTILKPSKFQLYNRLTIYNKIALTTL